MKFVMSGLVMSASFSVPMTFIAKHTVTVGSIFLLIMLGGMLLFGWCALYDTMNDEKRDDAIIEFTNAVESLQKIHEIERGGEKIHEGD